MIVQQPQRSETINEIIHKFENIYQNRDDEAIKWKDSGGKIVGCLGSDVPEELLIAAGILPVSITGNPKSDEINVSDQYLESGFDSLIRAQFGRIVNQAYSYLDYLIISNSSDAIIRAFYYLRALHHMKPEINLPKLYFFDFLHTRTRLSALYNRDRLKDFKKTIESWINAPITNAEIRKAIELCNESRRLLRELSSLRLGKEIKISGVEALKIIGSSMFMPKEKHNILLSSLLNQKEYLPILSNYNARLFVSGSSLDHPEFYEIVESTGAIIVGEDHDFGARELNNDVNPNVDPIDGIVDRYHFRIPSTHQATVSERVDSLVAEVKASNANGVIVFIHQSDDAPAWDFPEQKKALQKLNIPVLLLDSQPYVLEKESKKNDVYNKVSKFVSQLNRNNN